MFFFSFKTNQQALEVPLKDKQSSKNISTFMFHHQSQRKNVVNKITMLQFHKNIIKLFSLKHHHHHHHQLLNQLSLHKIQKKQLFMFQLRNQKITMMLVYQQLHQLNHQNQKYISLNIRQIVNHQEIHNKYQVAQLIQVLAQ